MRSRLISLAGVNASYVAKLTFAVEYVPLPPSWAEASSHYSLFFIITGKCNAVMKHGSVSGVDRVSYVMLLVEWRGPGRHTAGQLSLGPTPTPPPPPLHGNVMSRLLLPKD